LLCVFVYGCAPELTREEKEIIAFGQHPEWSEYHKDLIRRHIFETGMSPLQVELAWNIILTFERESSRGYSYYSANVPYFGSVSGYSGRYHRFRYRFCFYDDKLESWSKSYITY